MRLSCDGRFGWKAVSRSLMEDWPPDRRYNGDAEEHDEEKLAYGEDEGEKPKIGWRFLQRVDDWSVSKVPFGVRSPQREGAVTNQQDEEQPPPQWHRQAPFLASSSG